MDFEQDYIMRMVKMMIKAIMTILFGKKEQEEEETAVEGLQTMMKGDKEELFRLADSGQINKAENLLWEKADGSDLKQFHLCLIFYQHINEYSNEFLHNNQYSREEIIDGIKKMAERFGLSGMIESLL